MAEELENKGAAAAGAAGNAAGGTGTAGAADAAGAGDGGQKPAGTDNGTKPGAEQPKTLTLDEKQLAEREQRAAKAMIKSMAEQAGLDESGVQKLLDEYKTKKEAEKTDAQRATERAEKAEKELTAIKNQSAVLAAGVNPDFAEFVAYQAGKNVTSATDFPAALAAYVAANPKYLAAAGNAAGASAAGGYRQGSGTAATTEKQYLDSKYKGNPYYKP